MREEVLFMIKKVSVKSVVGVVLSKEEGKKKIRREISDKQSLIAKVVKRVAVLHDDINLVDAETNTLNKKLEDIDSKLSNLKYERDVELKELLSQAFIRSDEVKANYDKATALLNEAEARGYNIDFEKGIHKVREGMSKVNKIALNMEQWTRDIDVMIGHGIIKPKKLSASDMDKLVFDIMMRRLREGR